MLVVCSPCQGKIEPEFLYKPDAAIAMGRLLENPGRRREIGAFLHPCRGLSGVPRAHWCLYRCVAAVGVPLCTAADRWRLEDVSNSGERGLPFFGYKAATGTQGSTRALVAPTKYGRWLGPAWSGGGREFVVLISPLLPAQLRSSVGQTDKATLGPKRVLLTAGTSSASKLRTRRWMWTRRRSCWVKRRLHGV